MKRPTKLVLPILVVVITLAYFLYPRAAQPAEPLPATTGGAKEAASSANGMGFDLFAKLRTTAGNRCFSPYSIHTALSMAHAGAGGRTADQLAAALHLTAAARAGQRDLHTRLQAPGFHGFELSIANRMWLDRKFSVLPGIGDLLSKDFLADFATVDFTTPAALGTINDWTSQRTHDRIPATLAPADLPKNTFAVLTNALYFRGNWHVVFKKSETAEGDFFTAPGKTVRAMLMHQREKHEFAQFDAGGVLLTDTGMDPDVHKRLWPGAMPAFRALSLDYTGGDLAMVLLLPDIGQLDALEAALNEQILKAVVEHLHETELPVVLPRFTISDSYSLQRPLEDLGVTDAFSDTAANFSALSTQGVFLTAVVHKTFLQVNEEGTEAAAVTHGAVATSAPPLASPEFIANHPFLFLIRDKGSGAVLFLGRLANP